MLLLMLLASVAHLARGQGTPGGTWERQGGLNDGSGHLTATAPAEKSGPGRTVGAAGTGGTGAAVPPDSSWVPDTTGTAGPKVPWQRRPRWIMLRSVVVPGWGQWTNGKHAKALIVAAGEGYLLYRAFDWSRKEHEAVDKASRDRAASHRKDFTWWSVFAGILSMGDAYVDAQLGNFDQEFKPQDQSAARFRNSDLAFRVGLTLRLP
jgi:hypothetical protein